MIQRFIHNINPEAVIDIDGTEYKYNTVDSEGWTYWKELGKGNDLGLKLKSVKAIDANYLLVTFKDYLFNMRNYFFIALASALMIFNLYHINFDNIQDEENKVAAAGVLACLIAIILILILDKSEKINNKLD